MQKRDSDPTSAFRDSVAGIRDGVFGLADALEHMPLPGAGELHRFIQAANFNLAQAECELNALCVLGSARRGVGTTQAPRSQAG